MDEKKREELLFRNEELIRILKKKIDKLCPEYVDLIAIYGSFARGDYDERSDVDVLVVINDERGRAFAKSFIIGEVGYDFYALSWENLEADADFNVFSLSRLVDSRTVWFRESSVLSRFEKLRDKALAVISGGVSPKLLDMAEDSLNYAINAYGKAMLTEDYGKMRFYSAGVIFGVSSAASLMNATYFKLSDGRRMEEFQRMALPEGFAQCFMRIITEKRGIEIKSAMALLLRQMEAFLNQLRGKYIRKKNPTPEELRGTYEEMYSNYRGKILRARETQNPLAAFLAGAGCQDFYNDILKDCETQPMDLMKDFRASQLEMFAESFDKCLDEYKKQYDRQGMKVAKYESLKAFERDYLK